MISAFSKSNSFEMPLARFSADNRFLGMTVPFTEIAILKSSLYPTDVKVRPEIKI
jgi:hypothetical protein